MYILSILVFWNIQSIDDIQNYQHLLEITLYSPQFTFLIPQTIISLEVV